MQVPKKVAAAGLGLALLLGIGGGSYALWSSSTTLSGGSINSGDISVSAQSGATWKDVSPIPGSSPAPSKDTAIDTSKFKTVPGDVLQRTQTVTAKIIGDNMRANLTLGNFEGGSGNFFTSPEGQKYVKVVNQVLNSADGQVGTDNTVTLVSANYGAAGNTVPAGAIVVGADGTSTFQVRTTITFDPNTPDTVLTQASGELGKAQVVLQQVR